MRMKEQHVYLKMSQPWYKLMILDIADLTSFVNKQ